MATVPLYQDKYHSIRTQPKNPAGDQKFNYTPYTFSSDQYELEPSNTDNIKSLTGTSAVIYVSLHSIWSRHNYIERFGKTIQYNAQQWMRVTVCESSNNCLTSYVPNDDGRFSMWVPVPFYHNGRPSERIPGSEYAIKLYTDNISDVIETATLELIR